MERVKTGRVYSATQTTESTIELQKNDSRLMGFSGNFNAPLGSIKPAN